MIKWVNKEIQLSEVPAGKMFFASGQYWWKGQIESKNEQVTFPVMNVQTGEMNRMDSTNKVWPVRCELTIRKVT